MTSVRRVGDSVLVVLDRHEAAMIRQLVDDVRDLLAGPGQQPGQSGQPGQTGQPGKPGRPADPLEELTGLTESPGWAGPDGPGGPSTPDDPVLFRLLPDGYDEDAEAAAELRRFTEASLRQAKSETAERVLASLPTRGGEIRLDLPTADAWLRALNDVRLALGTRLDVTEETSDEVAAGRYDGDDPISLAHQVYAWLSGLQDLLVAAMIDTGDEDGQ